jgi:hypothetical protein
MTTCYLLLDGLNNLSKQSREKLRSILDSVQRQDDRVRVLITGTHDALHNIHAPTIHIEEHNQNDTPTLAQKGRKTSAQLQEGRIKSALCRTDHEWLFLPKLDVKNYILACKKTVQIGGEMDEMASFRAEQLCR